MKISKYILLALSLSLLIGCKTTFNMKSENKNDQKAEKLFDKYFNENKNAFLYSVGTIGPKYVWTYVDNQKATLTTFDISGARKVKQVDNIKNWTGKSKTTFNEIECPMVLGGDVLKIKFKNNKGDLFDQSLINEFECLEILNQVVIKNTVTAMTILKIK